MSGGLINFLSDLDADLEYEARHGRVTWFDAAGRAVPAAAALAVAIGTGSYVAAGLAVALSADLVALCRRGVAFND